ncbi:DoxX family membrane protein, partial [Rhizobium johnstonii]
AGLPASTALAYLAGLFELATGIALLVGFQVLIVGWLLAVFCVFTVLVFHLSPFNVPDFPAAANGWINGLNFVDLSCLDYRAAFGRPLDYY